MISDTPLTGDVGPAQQMRAAFNDVAIDFHDTYEYLAPMYNWLTQEKSRVSWHDLPHNQQALMIEVCANVLGRFLDDSRIRASILDSLSDEEIERVATNYGEEAFASRVINFIGKGTREYILDSSLEQVGFICYEHHGSEIQDWGCFHEDYVTKDNEQGIHGQTIYVLKPTEAPK